MALEKKKKKYEKLLLKLGFKILDDISKIQEQPNVYIIQSIRIKAF